VGGVVGNAIRKPRSSVREVARSGLLSPGSRLRSSLW
jgi:hypothetical protein